MINNKQKTIKFKPEDVPYLPELSEEACPSVQPTDNAWRPFGYEW